MFERKSGFNEWHFILIGAFFGVLIGGFTSVTTSDYEEEQIIHKEYCDMVLVWKHSNGDFGHPDYQDIFEEECL